MSAETGYVFTTVPTGKVVWVDSVNGVDATGVRGIETKPFLTPAAAKTAAASGDVVLVLPGAYTVAASLAKNGVNWHLCPGVTITWAEGSSTGVGIFDDGGVAMSYIITGAGDIVRTATDGFVGETPAVRTGHASSVVDIQCRDITCDDGGGGFSICVRGQAGRIRVKCRDLLSNATSLDGGYATWWDNGDMEVEGRYAWGASGAHYSSVNATPTGECDIKFDELDGLSACVVETGTQATATTWIRAFRTRSLGVVGTIVHIGAGRLYVEQQKIFGPITIGAASTGLLYVNSMKQSSLGGTNDTLYTATAGNTCTARIVIGEFDTTGLSGASITINAGTHEFRSFDFIGVAAANGISLTAGTLRIDSARINTVANNASNPITKSGGVLVLKNVTLVAEATRDSIEAATAQNVVAMASWANTIPDINVTITTGVAASLTVDADVI